MEKLKFIVVSDRFFSSVLERRKLVILPRADFLVVIWFCTSIKYFNAQCTVSVAQMRSVHFRSIGPGFSASSVQSAPFPVSTESPVN